MILQFRNSCFIILNGFPFERERHNVARHEKWSQAPGVAGHQSSLIDTHLCLQRHAWTTSITIGAEFSISSIMVARRFAPNRRCLLLTWSNIKSTIQQKQCALSPSQITSQSLLTSSRWIRAGFRTFWGSHDSNKSISHISLVASY